MFFSSLVIAGAFYSSMDTLVDLLDSGHRNVSESAARCIIVLLERSARYTMKSDPHFDYLLASYEHIMFKILCRKCLCDSKAPTDCVFCDLLNYVRNGAKAVRRPAEIPHDCYHAEHPFVLNGSYWNRLFLTTVEREAGRDIRVMFTELPENCTEFGIERTVERARKADRSEQELRYMFPGATNDKPVIRRLRRLQSKRNCVTRDKQRDAKVEEGSFL